ncbi:vitamin-D-receptor interacting mediator subunit 4-domain-containing protein [Chaetomium sp. MPI-SDFR-AT-0129]|nr:vitamin-D-receptor interacting mediator subunit 4-domain-containing protein [Chaetomium sp. MPI-SDFR-AT-0129]
MAKNGDLDACFERLEKSLDKMIDSIAKGNPSEAIAEELVACQNDLQSSMKLIETWQNNEARLQQLRQEVSLFDTQIKDIMSSLWNIRKEVKATQTTPTATTKKHQFTTAELLAFARRISRNTLPAPGVTNGVDMTAPKPPPPNADTDDSFRLQSQPTQNQTPNTSFGASFGPGITSGSTPGPVSAATPNTVNDTQPSTQLPPSQPTKTVTEEKLPEHIEHGINPRHGAVFYPWPTQEHIRSGALASLQRLIDAGIDPKGYDPGEVERKKQEEEQARKDAEERARQEREAAEQRMREERERMARERELARQREGGSDRRDSVAVGSAKPKQFTFLGADDDDDDDDD